jgi:hypothetical protein
MSLYVAADHRSLGVADELLKCSIGSQPTQLLVFEQNLRAQAFYRHGFIANAAREIDIDTGIWELRMIRTRGMLGAIPV